MILNIERDKFMLAYINDEDHVTDLSITFIQGNFRKLKYKIPEMSTEEEKKDNGNI
jgi:hypothetical protein